MFIGTINPEMRAVLAEKSHDWRGRPVCVGCSGNFTVERLLAPLGFADLRGNDVSLYSCAVGRHLAGQPFPLTVRSPEYDWLSPYLDDGPPRIACLLLCSEMLQYAGKDTPHHRRLYDAYRRQFPALHAATVEKVARLLEGVRLTSFYAGDVLDFLEQVPAEAAFVSFPPTYKNGYEKLYKKLHAAFAWDEPRYQVFDETGIMKLLDWLRGREHWMVSFDNPREELAEHLVAVVQTSPRARPVHVYADGGRRRLALPTRKVAPLPYERVQDDVVGPLTLVQIPPACLDLLRAEYLARAIVPAQAQYNYAVLAGGKLAGALAFNSPVTLGGDWCDAYMMSDFAVDAGVPRLSKLVLAASLSTEIKAVLEQGLCKRVGTIGTTVFTDRPVSMKYRGLYDLVGRKEGRLNYAGRAGKWSLAEALAWWRAKHGSRSRPSTAG